ncbi:hypothetical protein EJ02DRAFT_448412 [Clathrospora elynae]|uniref:Heterokaryon incompatibility domain-containing protein n=1 Tax=Clathrospora elynae TaxID=706981 RepID=A0A6A5S5D6_9PLEO|nr:hypothetical protein EJ02DRAFT_448412 [Clathrospora elynae]
MDRVIRFAQSINVTKLWIDKECIYQRKGDERCWPVDKERGVQIMDVVYGDSTASEVDTLSSLLHGSLFVNPKDKESPEMRPGVNIIEVQMLILRILSDPRFSRGWIFQEDHLASTVMTLLIPCNEKLVKGRKYDFGKIPGELRVKLATFRQTATMFCLACPEDHRRWPNIEILRKVKQYNIWNRKVYRTDDNRPDGPHLRLWSDGLSYNGGEKLNTKKNYSSVSIYPTTTNSVLDDICSRSVENEEDRLAILANALKFSKRLDIGKESPLNKPGKYSLSTALLALILMNGEILMNVESEPFTYLPSTQSLMYRTLQSYLNCCEYRFNAPNFRLHQTFIDRCRFKSPIITSRGIETKGFLFELLPRYQPGSQGYHSNPVRLSDRDRADLHSIAGYPRPPKMARGRKLDLSAHAALSMLIKKLDEVWPDGRLARYLHDHLQLDHNPPPPEYARNSTPIVVDMISALYQALLDDRELRLARLASAPADAEPTAIFITPEQDGWKTQMEDDGPVTTDGQVVPAKVFTSWDSGRNAYDKERLASLEVAICEKYSRPRQEGDEEHEECSMKNLGWVNGVWDVRGEEMGNYVFPLAGITEEPEREGDKKRKRGSFQDEEDD